MDFYCKTNEKQRAKGNGILRVPRSVIPACPGVATRFVGEHLSAFSKGFPTRPPNRRRTCGNDKKLVIWIHRLCAASHFVNALSPDNAVKY